MPTVPAPPREQAPAAHEGERIVVAAPSHTRLYLGVRTKLAIALGAALLWVALSVYLALPWVNDLGRRIGEPGAIVLVTLIAFFPGAMNAFIVASLLVDRRPPRYALPSYPPVSVLIAAYNEETTIAETVANVVSAGYPGPLEVIVVDDGSTDATMAWLEGLAGEYPELRVLRAPHGGKARALNLGLAAATHELIVSIDADTFLYRDALTRIVERFISDPTDTVAVAGAVLVRNSRSGILARTQEWDYFHGIAAVKRVQSLFQGTLVAQGAFSLYSKRALESAGGWPDKVGEDIVLTWTLMERGGRIGYAEDAVVFTNVPTDYRSFFQQRRRWSRGLIEAFRSHPRILMRPRLNMPFIYWNLLYPLLDAVYLFVFVPGVVAACFGHFEIAGPTTVAVLPVAVAINYVMYRTQRPMFAQQDLGVRRNVFGFFYYTLIYSLVLLPATLVGYFSEFLGLRKSWGTK